MDTQRIEENMTQHTPGPWKVREWAEVRPTKKQYGLCIYTDKPDLESKMLALVKEKDGEDSEANARLIAAAPELLSGCMAALAYLADPPSEYRENRSAAVETIRAAIAKAEGVRE